MTTKLKNAKRHAAIYYGLHMTEGLAEYREPGKKPDRILVLENALKKMDATFEGKPLYVQHVAEVDLDKLQEEADGYVVNSFFNTADGKHWCRFVVVSDAGHAAIRRGWKLSNCYVPKTFNSGGQWHGVDYSREVLDGEYEHLAIVDDPRYAESVIYTPEEFKAYNEEKMDELARFANSKDKTKEETTEMAFKLFKRTKVENAKDLNLDEMMVELPESKVELTLTDAIKAADKFHNMHGYANGDHMVKMGDEEMTVNQLMKKHNQMLAEMEELKNAGGEGEEADVESMDNGAEEDDKDREEEIEKAKKNKKKNSASEKEKSADESEDAGSEADADDTDADDADDADDAEAEKEKKQNAKEKRANFEKLKNAHKRAESEEESPKIILSGDMVARGKSRYGSG